MKTGKELKIQTFKNYNIVFGSVNNKHPKAIYINISAWADPQDDEMDSYNRTIKDLNKKIRQILYTKFNSENETFMADRTIVDLDIRESGIRYGKRSFMNCEITLFLKSELTINTDIMKEMLNGIVVDIIDNSFESNRTFKFYKKKKN